MTQKHKNIWILNEQDTGIRFENKLETQRNKNVRGLYVF